LRAARANHDFGADEKRIRTEIMVIDKNNDSAGFYPRSSIAYGCACHPYAIDDPRGRPFRSPKSGLLKNASLEGRMAMKHVFRSGKRFSTAC